MQDNICHGETAWDQTNAADSVAQVRKEVSKYDLQVRDHNETERKWQTVEAKTDIVKFFGDVNHGLIFKQGQLA